MSSKLYADYSELINVNICGILTTKLKQLLSESLGNPNLIWNGIPSSTVVNGTLLVHEQITVETSYMKVW